MVDSVLAVVEREARAVNLGQPLGAQLLERDKAELIRFFKTCEARNTRTRRGNMGISSPVFGLRPTRSPFWRTTKLPKDDSLTISPRTKALEISSRTESTNSADSLRDKPTSRYTASLKSARVTARAAMKPPHPCLYIGNVLHRSAHSNRGLGGKRARRSTWVNRPRTMTHGGASPAKHGVVAISALNAPQ